MASRVLALFDFDHTITSWDTAGRFFGWLLRRSPWRLGLVGLAVPVLGPLFFVRPYRKVPIRFGVWVATLGLSHEQLHAQAKVHIAEVTAQGGVFMRRDALRRIADHQAEGHEVVIATGALEMLACEVLLAGGVTGVRVVGSSVRPFLGGMVVHEHCFGERKIDMLAQRGFLPPWAYVYSDHEADLPILEAGLERFIVNPQPRSAKRLAARLGDSAKVVSWQ